MSFMYNHMINLLGEEEGKKQLKMFHLNAVQTFTRQTLEKHEDYKDKFIQYSATAFPDTKNLLIGLWFDQGINFQKI